MTTLAERAGLRESVEAFMLREAALLDAGDYAGWLDLFAEDGVYWVPAEPGQADPLNHVSILYEDKPILAMRIQRLAHPRAYANEPMPRATRLVSNVSAAQAGDGAVDASAAFVMTESRGSVMRLFSGRSHYRLNPSGGSFTIQSKRVDLLNCDSVHGLITLPF